MFWMKRSYEARGRKVTRDHLNFEMSKYEADAEKRRRRIETLTRHPGKHFIVLDDAIYTSGGAS